jgi:hypothetical protein
MEKYQKEVLDLQLKFHGQVASIEYNEMNEKFYTELEKEGIDINEYQEIYQKVTDYYSEGYEENKEESDTEFVKEVINDMKRLIEIANMIDEQEETSEIIKDLGMIKD